MKHVQSCLSAKEESRKQFSPLWMTCEARASLFIFGKDLTKPFQPQ